MSRIYDNWERLVAAVLKKEEIRQLCLALSISSDSDHNSISDGDSVCLSWGNDYTIWQSPSFRCNIVDWQKGELLGKGTFGAVYEGISEDGYFFAVKEVSLLDQSSQGPQIISQLEEEISVLSKLQHDNIVQYLGTEKDDAKLYILLELVTKGSLAKLYQKYQLRDAQVSAYTRQILSGLNYLHCRNVVHRDIKCANILVDVSGSVKLADFGLAKAIKGNGIKSVRGTPFWMAPEVVRWHGYDCAADIWSLGCTVLEMFTRQFPYSHVESMQALFRIGRGTLPPIPNTLPRDAQDFILKCLQLNPDDRPTTAQLLDHPFVKRPSPSMVVIEPVKIDQFNPDDRPTTAQLLDHPFVKKPRSSTVVIEPVKIDQVNPDDRPTTAQLLDHPFVKTPRSSAVVIEPVQIDQLKKGRKKYSFCFNFFKAKSP